MRKGRNNRGIDVCLRVRDRAGQHDAADLNDSIFKLPFDGCPDRDIDAWKKMTMRVNESTRLIPNSVWNLNSVKNRIRSAVIEAIAENSPHKNGETWSARPGSRVGRISRHVIKISEWGRSVAKFHEAVTEKIFHGGQFPLPPPED